MSCPSSEKLLTVSLDWIDNNNHNETIVARGPTIDRSGDDSATIAGAFDGGGGAANPAAFQVVATCSATRRGALRRLADFDRLVVAAGEAVAAALHGGEELLEVDLERREDLVGVVLGAEADLALGLAGVLDDLLGGALGLPVDLLARRSGAACWSRASLTIALGLALGLGEHLLALLDDPARLLDLLGDRRPHLIEQVVDLLAIDAHLVGQRHRPRVVDQVVELVYEYEDVHKRCVKAYAVGTGRAARGASFGARLQAPAQPQARATGATAQGPLAERRRDRLGHEVADVAAEGRHLLDARSRRGSCSRARRRRTSLSISGASLRLSWFISNSYSKSEIARRPLTIAVAPLLAGELDQQVGEDLDLDVVELGGRLAEEVAPLLGA